MQTRGVQLRGFVLAAALCAADPALAQDNTTQDNAARKFAAQDITPVVSQRSDTPIKDAAERIAEERWLNGLLDRVQSEGSTFRLNVRAPEVPIRAPWLDDDYAPGPTRRPTGGSIYHEEMLRHTVPEEFRTSTFNTPGVGIDPAVIVNAIRGVWRDWQVQRIRAQITRELQ